MALSINRKYNNAKTNFELKNAKERNASSFAKYEDVKEYVRKAEAGVTKSCDAKPANDSDHEQSDNQCTDSKKALADAWMTYKEGEL